MCRTGVSLVIWLIVLVQLDFSGLICTRFLHQHIDNLRPVSVRYDPHIYPICLCVNIRYDPHIYPICFCVNIRYDPHIYPICLCMFTLTYLLHSYIEVKLEHCPLRSLQRPAKFFNFYASLLNLNSIYGLTRVQHLLLLCFKILYV